MGDTAAKKTEERNAADMAMIRAAVEKSDYAVVVETVRTLLDERQKTASLIDSLVSMAATDGAAGQRAANAQTVAAFEHIAHELLTLLRELIGVAARDKGKA